MFLALGVCTCKTSEEYECLVKRGCTWNLVCDPLQKESGEGEGG